MGRSGWGWVPDRPTTAHRSHPGQQWARTSTVCPMPSARNTLLVAAGVAVLPALPGSALAAGDPLIEAMSAEIDRTIAALADQGADRPHYIAIEVARTESWSVAGEDGGLHGREPRLGLVADIDVRVGTPGLDSSHTLRKGGAVGSRWDDRSVELPQTDDVAILRHALWRELDRRFVEAKERWAKVQSEASTLVDEAAPGDHVPAPRRRDLRPLTTASPPIARWEAGARQASARLAASPSILDGMTSWGGEVVNRWFVDSAGTRLRHGESRWRASLSAHARAADGDELHLFSSVDAATPDGLPSAEAMLKAADALVDEMEALLAAPLAEPYNGPAILSDRAAAVFFHEVFGHRVEGHRLKRITDAQTFRNRVGEQILPSWLSVFDDPTLAQAAGEDLRGHFAFDNEGVAAQRVTLVEGGVLRGFLLSRSPVVSGDASNGHGRRAVGKLPVSRQGNLIVQAAQSSSDEQLRQRLRAMAKEAGLKFGLFIEEIAGGFTSTGRSRPNAFNVKADKAWRVFVDGRPDELVRGVDLIGTPLEAFSAIVAAGEPNRVFNGSCGAESGWVPVSAISPSLLLRAIETQRKQREQEQPPLLPPPRIGGPR